MVLTSASVVLGAVTCTLTVQVAPMAMLPPLICTDVAPAPVVVLGEPQFSKVGAPTVVRPVGRVSVKVTPLSATCGLRVLLRTVMVSVDCPPPATSAGANALVVGSGFTGARMRSVALKSFDWKTSLAALRAVAAVPGTELVTFSSVLTAPVCTGMATWQFGCTVPEGRGGTTASVMVMVRARVLAGASR